MYQLLFRLSVVLFLQESRRITVVSKLEIDFTHNIISMIWQVTWYINGRLFMTSSNCRISIVILPCYAVLPMIWTGGRYFSPDWHHSPHQYIHLRVIIGNILATQHRMGENAFHMVFQERWSFLLSCPETRSDEGRIWWWVGEKPCEMIIFWGHIVMFESCRIYLLGYLVI